MSAEPIARVGDLVTGTCNSHGFWTGVIGTGASTSNCDGSAIARVDDTGLMSCGHTFKITTGSPDGHTCEGKLIARKTDQVIVLIVGGTGTIQEGSSSATCS